MRVWAHLELGGPGLAAAELGEALAAAGVSIDAPCPARPAGPGLLLFAEISPAVCDALRRLSGGGRERVLAIAAPGARLGPDGPWRLLEAGASDVLAWGDAGASPAASVAARLERWAAVDDLLASPLVTEHLVGRSAPWRAVLRRVVEVARFTDAAVLVLGESGTGKEMIARLVHALDPRPRKGGLVVVDCTTIVPELAGSELFGHERGAFTGAAGAREGAFALADGGTLLLDEVGELPLGLQAQLLRVVQERTFKRVGGSAWQRAEFRLVSATNRDLAAAVERGQFRHDLYHRLASVSCTLPPLRERADDILPLARHFMRSGRPDGPPALDGCVEQYLLSRAYPGNVRELKQVALRILHRHVGPGAVTAGDVPEDERPGPGERPEAWRDAPFDGAIERALAFGLGLKDIGRAAEETAIDAALRAEGGNLLRAARRLGVTDRALQLRRAAARSAARPPDRAAAAADPGVPRSSDAPGAGSPRAGGVRC